MFTKPARGAIAVGSVFCVCLAHSARLYAADTYEPNGTHETAPPIASGSPIVSFISSSGDLDFYRFSLSAAQHVRIDLEVPAGADYMVQLEREFPVSGEGFRIDSLDNSGNGVGERFERTLEAGNYWIKVANSDLHPSHDPDSSYTLTLTTPLGGDTFEPNNTRETAAGLPLATTIASYKFTRNDADWYRIVLPLAAHVRIDLDVPNTVDYDVALYGGATNIALVTASQAGNGVDEQALITLSAGTYFVRVGRGNINFNPPTEYSQTDPYFLTVTSGSFGDSFEPNNVRAAARRIGPGSVVSKAYTTNDEDWYRFDVRSAGTVNISLDVPASADLAVELYSTASYLVGSDTEGAGVDESITHAVSGPATYFLRVFTHQPSTTENYVLTLAGATVAPVFSVPGDFDGNGTADLAVYRPSTGMWSVRDQFSVQHGGPGHVAVPGDYNGDRAADVAAYETATGVWRVTGQFAVQFGDPGDVPVPGDYNGDGVTDVAVYRPSTGMWYVRNQLAVAHGGPGDLPVQGDYNGDGATDVAVYRPSTGVWYVRNLLTVAFGGPGDVPVPADYDGDGSMDIAVYRSATGDLVRARPVHSSARPARRPSRAGDYDGDGAAEAAIYRPSTGEWLSWGHFTLQHGGPGDVPVPAARSGLHAAAGDYTGDGRTDIAVYRPSTSHWFVRGALAAQHGEPGDRPVPADYNGDGAIDVAVFRPSIGLWLVRGLFAEQLGDGTDVPVPGDYNGDGAAEVAVYRPSTATWYVLGVPAIQFGVSGDIPIPGDYNGDGITDIAVYRPSTGQWLARNVLDVQFGDSGDIPVPGDYNGDGVMDVAVYRPSTGQWFVRNQFAVQFGDNGDTPVPGDYNGDRRADIAVYRPSTGRWFVRNQFSVQFGDPGDVPVVKIGIPDIPNR